MRGGRGGPGPALSQSSFSTVLTPRASLVASRGPTSLYLTDQQSLGLVELSADIVAAYVSHNPLGITVTFGVSEAWKGYVTGEE